MAVVVAIVAGQPAVLTVPDGRALPSGPLLEGHRSLQTAVRAWVEASTGRQLGYLEQLYTFADPGRAGLERHVSVSYLGLTAAEDADPGRWVPWYDLFPWEDARRGSGVLDGEVLPLLGEWAALDASGARRQRVGSLFGQDAASWEPDLVLPRYETLWEAGLVPESPTDRRREETVPGHELRWDHRRIAATAMARLRSKIQYRPVVFELMPPTFTLGQLQAVVESLAGRAVHTQNFRRLVEQQQRLVEETGEVDMSTGGRPARLYRFRRDVLAQRHVSGTKLPTVRSR